MNYTYRYCTVVACNYCTMNPSPSAVHACSMYLSVPSLAHTPPMHPCKTHGGLIRLHMLHPACTCCTPHRPVTPRSHPDMMTRLPRPSCTRFSFGAKPIHMLSMHDCSESCLCLIQGPKSMFPPEVSPILGSRFHLLFSHIILVTVYGVMVITVQN